MKEENNMKQGLQWNADLCAGTQACVSRCTFGALSYAAGTLNVDADLCRLCGACVKACPSDALTLPIRKSRRAGKTRGGIWVWAETDGNHLLPVSLELTGKAAELSRPLHLPVEVVLTGTDVEPLAQELIAHGADRVYLIEHPIFKEQIEEHCVAAVARLAEERQPEIILVGATPVGRGLSARLAATLKTGLTADCTALSVSAEDGLLLQRRPAFGGNLMATIITPAHRPQMASVRPGVMKASVADFTRKGEVVRIDCSDLAFDTRIRTLEQTPVHNRTDQLENSRIVIGIGRGVKASLLPKIERFAESIGATVAGSRAAVEAGLINASVQIGQTGHTIAPDLYVALGISGQIQHVAAIGGAKKVIAVNRDPYAPIFNYADFGWQGTVEEALPVLAEMIR